MPTPDDRLLYVIAGRELDEADKQCRFCVRWGAADEFGRYRRCLHVEQDVAINDDDSGQFWVPQNFGCIEWKGR